MFIVVVEVFARWARLTGRLLAVIGERSQEAVAQIGSLANATGTLSSLID